LRAGFSFTVNLPFPHPPGTNEVRFEEVSGGYPRDGVAGKPYIWLLPSAARSAVAPAISTTSADILHPPRMRAQAQQFRERLRLRQFRDDGDPTDVVVAAQHRTGRREPGVFLAVPDQPPGLRRFPKNIRYASVGGQAAQRIHHRPPTPLALVARWASSVSAVSNPPILKVTGRTILARRCGGHLTHCALTAVRWLGRRGLCLGGGDAEPHDVLPTVRVRDQPASEPHGDSFSARLHALGPIPVLRHRSNVKPCFR